MIEFLVATTLFTCLGMQNEGLVDTINQDGWKSAMSQVWEAREPVDYSIMND